MNKEKSDCFYKITNQEVYVKLLQIEEGIKKIHGKVILNRWISTTALSLSFLLLGFCLANF